MPNAALPSTQLAVMFTGPQQAALQERPHGTAPLASDEVAGRTLVSLISPGTEINWAYSPPPESPRKIDYPVGSGYAAIMELDAVGDKVTDVAPGDHVFVMGNHAARQRAARSSVVPVPRGLAPARAVFCRLLGVSWSTLVTTTARPPDRVLVTGLGPVGNLAAQIFHAAGYRVVAVDPVESRRAAATAAGLPDVRAAVPTDDQAIAGQIALAVECAGHELAVRDACQVVRKRGEVVLVGVPWRKRADLQAFDVLNLVFHRYLILRSGWEWEIPTQPRDFTVGSIMGNLAGALDWLAQGRIRVDGLFATHAPADCQAAYQDLLHQRGLPARVFDWRLAQGATATAK